MRTASSPAQEGALRTLTSSTKTSHGRRVAAVVAAFVLAMAILVAVRPAAAADARPTVAGLISAAVEISPALARLEAGNQMVPRGSVLTRAGVLRPAADLGAWARSKGYARVTPELGDALAEGAAPDATTREWTLCYQRGNGVHVICPDGFIEVN